MDHENGYGPVSRFFHWTMALLLLWQVISAALHYFYDDTPVTDFFFGWHFTNGVAILVLAVLRGAWGLLNIPRRPPHTGPVERVAVVGHIALYALMIIVPVIALIRAYGSDHGFSAFGVQLFAERQTEIEWMTDLGGAWHGFLGWTLFLLIAGHITMAFVHSYVWKQPMIARMTRGSER